MTGGDRGLRNLTNVMDLGFGAATMVRPPRLVPGDPPAAKAPDLPAELRDLAAEYQRQAGLREDPKSAANLLGISTGLKMAAQKVKEWRVKP